ncbi:hypothetical protein CLAFUW4_03515 [Fulvia fulva]|uniref:Uncharacterized protein n=1 Tax=Passalora fulva TaxID=5499 RepID=A0A9Q8LB49_PASFU|nr:uncharacterized protein CLAFUR5_03494 [Fulvia fulva]KAK4632234.1 hypothetical protein CLAFUR4_03504 [Fulvia fulva]KAK4633731.1 hypothetical protein CLAFUR0_03509 [Fulvia fulva]UJO14125.1 hypothetical protein CLAFUR5_03494 [Fulvia fulva]WPV10953.1 hypothetical protein CLAFUW4_03515 [Fulvia fulva]WPV25549.1 hypothetical protein CLAFUW7_03507 [Fulvia fulva]
MLAPSADSDPDLDIPLNFSMASLDPIGTPRRSGSLASSMNGLSATNSNGNVHLAGLGGVSGSRFFSNGVRSNGVATPPIENNGSAAGLYQRFEWLKDKESTKDKLTEEILARYAFLEGKHDELLRQLEEERSNRSTQPSNNEEMYRSYMHRMTEMLNREAFMLILIDGDGMVFNNVLLRLGEKGGQEAAKQLRNTVHEWAKTTLKDCPSDFKVVARIYANVNGLAETCRRAGLVSSPEIITDFVRGFTNSGDLFNFIDVGPSKDRADFKMNAEFKLHIWNYQCRHILFGCSHDNGFARLLEGYAFDDEARSRVTLLEGVKFEKELAKLPFNKKKLDGLFRESKINLTPPDLLTDLPRDRHDSKNSFNPASGVFTPASRTPVPDTPLYSPKTLPPPGITTPAPSVRGDLTRTNSIASSTAVSDTPAVAAPTGGTRGGGWANVARASAGLPLQDLTKKPSDAKIATGPVIRQNKDGYRVDAHMEYHHDRVYELKKMKYCNQHYIGRGCCHWNSGNGNCPHKHDTKLSKDDLKWLRVVARETVCKKGASCLEFDCIYGHHCPYPKMTEGSLRGIGCINGESCRFAKEMHGMDTTVATILRPEDLE